MNEAMMRNYTPAERAYILRQWEELQPEIEAMKETWQRLKDWEEENCVDLSKCSMRSRLAGPWE